jgi:hypothetical protein
VHNHPAAFWLVLVGGVLTVAGIGLTVKTVFDIGQAVRRFDKRVYVSGFASLAGRGPRPPIPTRGLPLPLEDRVLILEQKMSQLTWELRYEILEAAQDARDEAARASERRAFELSNAMRELINPLTRDWRMAGVSAALLLTGVILQTVGSLLAL